jgi:5-formyltetrahydrofolate cyclo-ligase
VSALPPRRLKEHKRALRREIVERRDALPAERRRAASRRIADRVLGLPDVVGAGTVMAFWSFGSEVQTAELLERLHRAGKRVALPRVEEGEVVAVAYAPGGPVTAAHFGAMEPLGADVVPPEDVDVVLVPGVAFDRRGARVGYGGGFYDRFLPRRRPGVPAIAIAFSVQLVDEVPEGGMDRRVDAIVTENELITCRRAG